MYRQPFTRTILAMTNPEAIELDVRLLLVGEELTGEVVRDGYPACRFSGWLGLLGAVERACELRLPSDDCIDPPPRGEEGRP